MAISFTLHLVNVPAMTVEPVEAVEAVEAVGRLCIGGDSEDYPFAFINLSISHRGKIFLGDAFGVE